MAEIKDANGSPPAGYHKLPDGVRCRCMRLWRSASGDHYCCRPKASDPTGADPAGVASEAVERLTLAAERAEAKDAFHAATADAGDLRFLLSDYKARGEEIERLRTEKTEAIRLVSQYAREAGFAKGKLEASELAGVVDSWREHAEAQALRIKALENENAALVAWQGNPVLEATIAAQGERIVELVDAANVALGHLTGGMDGDWRDCDPAELLRTVLSSEDSERITALNASVEGEKADG